MFGDVPKNWGLDKLESSQNRTVETIGKQEIGDLIKLKSWEKWRLEKVGELRERES